MKWTKGRLKEKECLEYFIPSWPQCYKPPELYPDNFRWDTIKVTEKDWEDFFNYSEQGIEPKDFELSVPIYNEETGNIKNFENRKPRGFHLLLEAKRWRGIYCDSTESHRAEYETGILEGTSPYYELLGGYGITVKRKWYQLWKPKHTHKHTPIPRAVVDYMKKSLFQGKDAEIIENCYQSILVDK